MSKPPQLNNGDHHNNSVLRGASWALRRFPKGLPVQQLHKQVKDGLPAQVKGGENMELFLGKTLSDVLFWVLLQAEKNNEDEVCK